MKSSTKGFLFGMVVGAVAYHILVQSGGAPVNGMKKKPNA